VPEGGHHGREGARAEMAKREAGLTQFEGQNYRVPMRRTTMVLVGFACLHAVARLKKRIPR